ncbi:MAG: hypothetical protein PHE73_03750 [Sulfurovaceae bacterium]|nr:hypothetical protein [Sulfurovaceae bacterium]
MDKKTEKTIFIIIGILIIIFIINKIQESIMLQRVEDQAKENLKTINEMTKTTNQMFKKISDVPQIQMPQIQIPQTQITTTNETIKQTPKNEIIKPTDNEEERLKAKEEVLRQMKN